MRAAVAFLCSFALVFTSSMGAFAQSRQAFALADSVWEIAYTDARLGEVQGIAKITGDQGVTGFYMDPRDGSEHPFKGVARLEMLDGKAVATIDIEQTGPYASPPFGESVLETTPGGQVTAQLGDKRAVLNVLNTSAVTLELELYEKTASFGGLWKAEDDVTTPLRAGTQVLNESGTKYAAGPEVWLPSAARFRGRAELRDVKRNLSDGKKADEQTFVLKLRGIGLPPSDAVKKRTVDFKDLSGTLRLDYVWPASGDFGRALDLRVKAKELPEPGEYPLTLNGIDGLWTLEYKDLKPTIRLMRQLRVDEYEEMAEIYLGEDVFVEVEFGDKATAEDLDFSTYTATLLDADGQQHSIALKKVSGGVFRSGTYACQPKEEGAKRDGTGQLVCAEEGKLTAFVSSGSDDQDAVAIPMVKAPSPLWDEAMERAEACRTASFDQNVKGVNVQKQVHAALILLRDEMLASISESIATNNEKVDADPALRMAKLKTDLDSFKDMARRGQDHPVFLYEVDLPPQVGSGKIPLKDALTGNYEPKLDEAARKDYERIATSQAQGEMLGAAQRTQARLQALKDCDLEGLLQFGKLGNAAFNAGVKAKLMRKGLPGEAAWMPDLAARASMDSIAGVVAAVKAEEAYRQAKVDFALTTLTMVTGGAAIAATASRMLARSGIKYASRLGVNYSKSTITRLAAAAELSELAELGNAGLSVYDARTSGTTAVENAEGLAPVIGVEAARTAQDEKDAQIKGAAILAAASGAGAAGAGVLGRLAKQDPTAGTRTALGPKGEKVTLTAPKPPKEPVSLTAPPKAADAGASSGAGDVATAPPTRSGGLTSVADNAGTRPTVNSNKPDGAPTVRMGSAADPDAGIRPTVNSNKPDAAVTARMDPPVDNGAVPPTVNSNKPDAAPTVRMGSAADQGGAAAPTVNSNKPDGAVTARMDPPVDNGAAAPTVNSNKSDAAPTVRMGSAADQSAAAAPTVNSNKPDGAVAARMGPPADNGAAAPTINSNKPDAPLPVQASSAADDFASQPTINSNKSDAVPGTVVENAPLVDPADARQVAKAEAIPKTVIQDNPPGPSTPQPAVLDGPPSGTGVEKTVVQQNPPADPIPDTVRQPAPARPLYRDADPILDDQLVQAGDSPFNRDYSRQLEINKDPRGILSGPDVRLKSQGQPARTIPGNKIMEYDPVTRQPRGEIALGEPLGYGANSTVFRDAAEPKTKVRRLTQVTDKTFTSVEDDIIGRRILEREQQGASYFRVTEQDAGATRLIQDPNDPGRQFLVTREESLAEVINGTNVTDAYKRFGPGMPPPNAKQQATMTLAIRELNAKGIVWSDHKLPNFDIVEDTTSPTGYRMVIFDTGGIRPVVGKTPADRAANARRLQRVYDNTPRENFGQYWAEHEDLLNLVDNRAFGNKPANLAGSPGANLGRTRYLGLDDLSPDELTVEIGRTAGAPLRLPGAQ